MKLRTGCSQFHNSSIAPVSTHNTHNHHHHHYYQFCSCVNSPILVFLPSFLSSIVPLQFLWRYLPLKEDANAAESVSQSSQLFAMLNLWYIVTTVRFEEDGEAAPGLYTSMECLNIGQMQHLPAHNLPPSLTPLLPSFLPQLFSALSNRCPATPTPTPKPKACATSDKCEGSLIR